MYIFYDNSIITYELKLLHTTLLLNTYLFKWALLSENIIVTIVHLTVSNISSIQSDITICNIIK